MQRLTTRNRLQDVRRGDRCLIIVAHPDDETFGCGSLIAHAASHSAHVTVLCATRGEAGEPTDAVAAGTDLGAVREAELRSAAEALGATEVALLDHLDSGFNGDPIEGSLCAASPELITAEVADRLMQIAPTVIIVLDGSDGHRDHIRIRRCVIDAVRAVTPDVDTTSTLMTTNLTCPIAAPPKNTFKSSLSETPGSAVRGRLPLATQPWCP